jgi:uracil-DNA glycosylase
MDKFFGMLHEVGWYEPLKDMWHSEELTKIAKYLTLSRKSCNIFPNQYEVFKALRLCPYDSVKVVILGQDPYPSEAANGLAFALRNGSKMTPSLRNIFKEIEYDLKVDMDGASTDLTGWANQGVLLLNSVLTVEGGKPGSHSRIGWQSITDQIIQNISKRQQKQVFMLWGNHAQEKIPFIPRNKYNNIMIGSHPAAYAAKGFFGQRYFSECNNFLNTEIDWTKTSLVEDSVYDIFTGHE